MHPRLALASLVGLTLVACSSSSSTPVSAGGGGGDGGQSADGGGGATIVLHGTIVDYFTLKPVGGLTVADNGVTTTTDANGAWSLAVPSTATVLQPIVTGPKYTKLLFPDSMPTGGDVDFGTSVMPDSSTYNLEQLSLSAFDPGKALVQVVLIATGACKSVVGGTAKVVSPAGATLTYFSKDGVPAPSETAFQDVQPNRPVVVVDDIDVGADLVLEITHPTCKQVAFPSSYAGKTYSGRVRTEAAEPGDVNAAIVIVME
jgi:hypothetical protein